MKNTSHFMHTNEPDSRSRKRHQGQDIEVLPTVVEQRIIEDITKVVTVHELNEINLEMLKRVMPLSGKGIVDTKMKTSDLRPSASRWKQRLLIK